MIRYVRGVPRWITWLSHKTRVRGCNQTGHFGPAVPLGACERCGFLWFTEGQSGGRYFDEDIEQALRQQKRE